MEIKSLENTSPSEIYQCFIKAFKNYFVSIPDDERLHIGRWVAGGVDYHLSFGAFIDNKLAGFILHSPNETNVFNLLTGVHPNYRGRKVIDHIYQSALPKLKARGLKTSSLEVITINHRAIKVYERNGFRIERELICFKGTLPNLNGIKDTTYHVKDIAFTQEMRELIDYPYTVEQSEEVLLKKKDQYEVHELKKENQLLAYGIFSPQSLTFAQAGARRPFRENLEALLGEMKLSKETIRMNNIDQRHKTLISVWEELGLRSFISQYEMTKIL